MPDEAFNWMGRIKAVEREYGAIRFGTDRLLVAVNDDPAILEGQVRRPDIGTAAARLEGTYIVRVFSEFETALQHFTRVFHIRRPGNTEALVNRVRDRGHIAQADTDAVHRVREYRNVLVHDRSEPVAAVTIREATRYLCTFLSRVQRIW
ncbi:MAG: hypothetical protein WD403_02170 [Pirellulales bacterium]